MAMISGGVVQDENHHIHFNGISAGGKANILNSQKKSGLRSRKPLGDLSNSRKPVLNQPSKWQTTKNSTFIDEDKKKSTSKGSEKIQTGTRKALSNISNSRKPSLHEAHKKTQNMKSGTLRMEPLQLDAIYEEGFLHNHGECMKAQKCAMDMDEFLGIVGLDGPREMLSSSKPDSPLEYLVELKETVESPKKIHLFERFDSSPPCMSPKSPLWKHSHIVNFTLMELP